MREIEYILKALQHQNVAMELAKEEREEREDYSITYLNSTIEEVVSKADDGLNKDQVREMLNFLISRTYLQKFNEKPFQMSDYDIKDILEKEYIK